MPILGICRGAQLLNVACQGTLHQHVPDLTNGTVEHRQSEVGTRTSHEVRVAPDSSLAQTTGGGPVKVNSFHHQAIDRLGFGLRAVAWSEDGLIEAIEEQDGRFVLGVQWHAETLVADAEQLSLFERLVEATRHPVRPPRASASASAPSPAIAASRRTPVPMRSSARSSPTARRRRPAGRSRIARPRRPRERSRARSPRPPTRRAAPRTVQPGAWSRWAPTPRAAWTVGVEEEVMLLDPSDWALASQADAVMSRLTGELASHTSTETHGSALELRTDPHATVAAGLAQLEELRGDLARELAPLGLRAAVAGLHPFTLWQDTQISDGDRYRFLYGSMRELARREPTFALHVHVAVPDPESAVRAINRLRSHLPLLLALSANSPFWQGRETGPRLDAHAAVPGVPARRHPARLPRLRRLRLDDRPAAALRGVSRADVPVVGRSPAAALRHDRGAHHGRADDGRRLGRADGARAVPGAPRGQRRGLRGRSRDRPARGARREPLPRRARRRTRRA